VSTGDARRPRRAEAERDVSRVVIATAGHVDHGKTSLILALTGTDTDRLPDEKRRGISIELGFAELAEHGISFVDVPGHEKLVHAMIAGVGGVDAVLCVVAADDGVMPQTREHLCVCSLLGIRRVVVALSKADLVDDETLELAQADARATLDALGFTTEAVVPTSTTNGRGIEELKAALGKVASSVAPRAESGRLWLPIDRAFSIKGAGSVVTGTLTRGCLKVGDRVFVASESGLIEASCRSIEIHGRAADVARAPTRVAVNLPKLELGQLARGSVLVNDPELPVAKGIDIVFSRVPSADSKLEDRSPVLVYAGTTRRTARIFSLGEGLAHLALDAPLPCQGGVGIVLRGFSTTREWGAVLGGGRVLDADPPPLPKKKNAKDRERRGQLCQAAARGEWPLAIAVALSLAAPRPLSAQAFDRRFGLEAGDTARRLGGKKQATPAIALPGGDLFTQVETLSTVIALAVKLVQAHHQAHAADSGIGLETLRSKLAERSGRELADAAIGRAKANRQLLVEAGVVATPDFAATASPGAQRLAERVLTTLESTGLSGSSEAALGQKLSDESSDALRATLARLSTGGKARRLSDLWFAESELDRLRARVVELLSTKNKMSVNDFKEIAGVGRKQAIPLLEQLDREGTTRRVGDERVLGASAKKT
jgi:selenocysteine-specific elongation factor